MGLHERLEIAKDAQTPAAGSKPLGVKTKPESANAKKVSAQKKAQKSSESSYAEHSDKLKKNKDVIMISNRQRGRPKSVQAECKLTDMVEAILQSQVKEASLMISTVKSLLK